MKPRDHEFLNDLRRALLGLHKTLLEWERHAYERVHGRASPGELLKIVMQDPQFAWLHPLSELIVRIDALLEADAPDVTIDVGAIASQARLLVVPDEAGSPYAQRYHTALQEHPDAVLAHRVVTRVLHSAPVAQERLH